MAVATRIFTLEEHYQIGMEILQIRTALHETMAPVGGRVPKQVYEALNRLDGQIHLIALRMGDTVPPTETNTIYPLTRGAESSGPPRPRLHPTTDEHHQIGSGLFHLQVRMSELQERLAVFAARHERVAEILHKPTKRFESLRYNLDRLFNHQRPEEYDQTVYYPQHSRPQRRFQRSAAAWRHAKRIAGGMRWA